jgi:drug/metabolite transporter (DMT)-like permease
MPRSQLKAYIALACVCFFWGTTFIASRIAINTFPVTFLSGIRFIFAGSLLGIYFFGIKKNPLPPLRELASIVFNGLLMIGAANGLLTFALNYMPTNTASTICASLPFWILGLNLLFHKTEKVNSQTFVGLVVGFVGLLIIFYDGLFISPKAGFSFGLLLTIISNLSWALGMVFTKKYKVSAKPFVVATIQLLSAGVVMCVLGFLTIDNYDFLSFDNAQGWLAILYLATFGSVVGYGAYIYSLAHLPVTVVSIYTYINPLIAIWLSWWILDEKINTLTWLSVGLILVSVYIVNRGFNTQKEAQKLAISKKEKILEVV